MSRQKSFGGRRRSWRRLVRDLDGSANYGLAGIEEVTLQRFACGISQKKDSVDLEITYLSSQGKSE